MGCSDSHKYGSHFRQNHTLFNMIQNVGFVAHVNGVFSNARLEPQEVSCGTIHRIFLHHQVRHDEFGLYLARQTV
ncbi:hypothetical protein NPIL_401341 [Nephila pilipes]|uniref:Uncharacterized protein n=1 Tax=Nephila pilipes TaxID=299642 RepID=A0A8X6QF65_NEPPI|nr:hypothetical protein NPIL_401341 [Nephila pilipes]